jgi:hypothetical protein
MRGCLEPAPAPVLDLDGESIHRCPVRHLTADVARLLKLYGHYRNGFLPVAGGVLDQTPQFLEAMAVIAQQVAEQERSACRLSKKSLP